MRYRRSGGERHTHHWFAGWGGVGNGSDLGRRVAGGGRTEPTRLRVSRPVCDYTTRWRGTDKRRGNVRKAVGDAPIKSNAVGARYGHQGLFRSRNWQPDRKGDDCTDLSK